LKTGIRDILQGTLRREWTDCVIRLDSDGSQPAWCDRWWILLFSTCSFTRTCTRTAYTSARSCRRRPGDLRTG